MIRPLAALVVVAFALVAPTASAQDTGTYVSGTLDWGQDTSAAWVDHNGDGKADYCRLLTGSRLACTISTGRGFGVTFQSDQVDPGYTEGRVWGDVDGDGRADYCRRVGSAGSAERFRCTRSTGAGFEHLVAESASWGSSYGAALADFNGDGRADYCRVLNTPPRAACTLGPDLTKTVSSPQLDPGYDNGRAWVDLNADGRADYCRVLPGTIACSPSTGTGFGSTVTSFTLDIGYDAGRAWVDIDGDRRADHCRRVGDSPTTGVLCALTAAVGFSDRLRSPPVEWGHLAGSAWVDFDGDGDRDFCRPVGQTATTRQLFCTLVDARAARFGATIASGPLDAGPEAGRAWVDHNGDGKADYCRRVTTASAGSAVACTISNGTGFGPLPVPTVTAPPSIPQGSPPPASPSPSQPTVEPPRILVTLAFDYSANRTSTLLRTLRVKGVPRGATVTARCPKGCARKRYVKRNARGTVSLKPLLGKRLKVGATITVEVTKPGSIGAVKVLRIRARKAPQVTTRCLPPGTSRPARCSAQR